MKERQVGTNKSLNERHIIWAFHNTFNGTSKLSRDVLNVAGWCPPNIRHFLNNLCSFNGCKYLEVGTFQGASLLAASYRNPGEFHGIDDFSQFDNVRNNLDVNLQKFQSETNISFHEGDCWAVDPSAYTGVNVYLYDGDHSLSSQTKGVTHFFPAMADEFVLLVDDYSWKDSTAGAAAGLADLDITVKLRVEVHDDCNERGWWNGLLALFCKKGK